MRQSRLVVVRGWGRGKWRGTANRDTFTGDENVLELGSSGSCMTLNTLKNTELCTFKGNFVVYKLNQ